MGLPAKINCLGCGVSGPFPCPSTANDESFFEVHGRYGGLGIFRCRKCESFNLMKFRLIFASGFVDVIRASDPRYEKIVKTHAQLFPEPNNEDNHTEPQEIGMELQKLGKSVTLQDLIDTTSPGGHAIEFSSLDRATKLVFDRLVRRQAELFGKCFPAAVPQDTKALLFAVGGHLFIGFIVGRRLFQTHRSIITFSGDAADVVQKATLLETLVLETKPEDFLAEAGENFVDFLNKWAEIHAKLGIYADIPSEEAAPELLYVTLLNGWSLSIAEYQMPLAK